jgi:N-acetylglucosamine-6-phosphate deacetylase
LKAYPKRQVIRGVKAVLPTKVLPGAVVEIEGRQIVSVTGSRETEGEDQEDWLVPGLIDIHVHGAGGADIMDAQPASLQKVAQTLLREGTTAFLAATMTADEEHLSRSLKALAAFIRIYGHEAPVFSLEQEQSVESPARAACLGIYLEGPFLSPQYAGAHNGTYLQEPSLDLLHKYRTWSENNLKIVTLAPELARVEAVIRDCLCLGIIPAAGHSAATWAEAQQALSWGIRHITHGFNAMRPLHHREPALIGMALTNDAVKVEIIADLQHLHPAVLDILYRLKGTDGLILISDGMRAVGMPEGVYDIGGQTAVVGQGKVCLADGTLAGSASTLLDGVRSLIYKVGIPIPEAVRMATLGPARLLGLDWRTGSLEKGKEATFLRLDPNWNLKEVWIRGKMIPVK